MLSLTRSSADLMSSFLLKWAMPITATCSASASSLSGVRTPRTSADCRLSTLPMPRYALTGSMMTSTTLPIRSIALRKRRRSVTRLNVLSSPPMRALVTRWTCLGSAPAATNRGKTVSRAPSSALNQITLPCGAVPSSHGSAIAAVTAAAMKAAICPLPMSGRPATNPNLPLAKRPGHSQSTPHISKFAAVAITSSSLSSVHSSPVSSPARLRCSLPLLSDARRGCTRPALAPLSTVAHGCCAVFCYEAARFGGGKQALADLVCLLIKLTASYELEQIEGGAIERVVTPAVLRHGGELVALVAQCGAAVDRAADGRWQQRRRGGLPIGIALDRLPAGCGHDLAGLGDEAPRQRLID